MINSLKQGFLQLFQYKRIWLKLYLLTFALAAFVAYPLKTYLEDKVGHSLMVKDMMEGFNYTFYTDFMNHYGDGISPILNQSSLVIILYVLLLIFLMGGIINTFLQREEKYNRTLFWGNCANYFWRIFRLTIYFLLIHGFVLGIFLWIYTLITKGLSPTNLESEGIIFVAMKYMTPIYILFASFFFMWQDYTKISLVKNNDKLIYPAMKNAFVFIIKNFRKTFGLYLINMFLLALVLIINYFITAAFEIRATSTIFISFFISQLLVIIRLGLKLVNLSSAGFMYQPLEKSGY